MNHAGKLFHNALSASSQKIRLALAEKKLRWDSEEIDLRAGQQHSPAYRQLNPAGVVPTLVRDGETMVESSAILEYLDDVFPDQSLRPNDQAERARMRALIRRLDDIHHAANGFLTYAVLVRPSLLALDPTRLDAMIAAMPDARARASRREAQELGVESPMFPDAVKTQIALLDTMDGLLARTDHLAGDALSLADITALPYVARLDHMGWTATLMDGRPRVADWLARMRTRQAYAEAIDRWMPPAVVAQWLALGQAAWPAASHVLEFRPHGQNMTREPDKT
ncbi:glutathione S-transferase family protein [Bradyrhizobium prioriisuperbiae]|uniref:glutathione S-transferase family protein n=1 Tax=Bradyrhizobium prioriisuperbiae TaxID=2854389 RepID=UPI0028E30B7F|nr:glutathione S-transferase family protein [Bradyrhizobium prioritasuperba]